MAGRQISPGIAHTPSCLCTSDLRRHVPYTNRALRILARSPHAVASIRFLYVVPAFCFRLPSDPQSPRAPFPCATTCPCRPWRGLSPPSACALPGAPKKRASRSSPRGGSVGARRRRRVHGMNVRIGRRTDKRTLRRRRMNGIHSSTGGGRGRRPGDHRPRNGTLHVPQWLSSRRCRSGDAGSRPSMAEAGRSRAALAA